MPDKAPPRGWASGDAYEPYVGRWSRLVAASFIDWLCMPTGAVWVDVGCGTGALTQTILANAEPRRVYALDRSSAFVSFARARTPDDRAVFAVADARALPVATHVADAAVSGLVLNFVPDHLQMVHEMGRVLGPGGLAAVYVWDYAGRMELMRYFWDAAAQVNPSARTKDEGPMFTICAPRPLEDLFGNAGFSEVEVQAIDVPTVFRDFEDYWTPFLSGQAPAPEYLMSLSEAERSAVHDLLRLRLPTEYDGSIHLVARAWAVRGRKL